MSWNNGEPPGCAPGRELSVSRRGAGTLAQQRQNVFRVQPQRPLLVLAGEVEGEVAEAQIKVRLDRVHLRLRVVRDDPAAGRSLSRPRVGAALPLGRGRPP